MKEDKPDARRGLYYLGGTTKKSLKLEDCGRYASQMGFHPFGLVSPAEARRLAEKKIIFIRADNPEKSFEVFIAHFRHLTHKSPDLRVRKLRIITMESPYHPGQNYDFFEVWVENTIYISDGIADSRGAGKILCMKYEDVLSLLSKVFELDVKRIGLAVPAPISSLYNLRESIPTRR